MYGQTYFERNKKISVLIGTTRYCRWDKFINLKKGWALAYRKYSKKYVKESH